MAVETGNSDTKRMRTLRGRQLAGDQLLSICCFTLKHYEFCLPVSRAKGTQSHKKEVKREKRIILIYAKVNNNLKKGVKHFKITQLKPKHLVTLVCRKADIKGLPHTEVLAVAFFKLYIQIFILALAVFGVSEMI